MTSPCRQQNGSPPKILHTRGDRPSYGKTNCKPQMSTVLGIMTRSTHVKEPSSGIRQEQEPWLRYMKLNCTILIQVPIETSTLYLVATKICRPHYPCVPSYFAFHHRFMFILSSISCSPHEIQLKYCCLGVKHQSIMTKDFVKSEGHFTMPLK